MNFLRPKEELKLLDVSKPLRDDVMISTPLMTGLSPGELAAIDLDDIYFEYNLLFVWRSKTSRDHPVVVDPETMFKIHQYADKRKTGPLFQLEGNGPSKVQKIRRIVKKWAREASLARWHRVTPYTLRHTFCVKWVVAGGSLEGLRRQLGLKDLQKLRHYLDFDYSHVKVEYHRIFGDVMWLGRVHWNLPLKTPYIV